jgi:hypothetical protein
LEKEPVKELSLDRTRKKIRAPFMVPNLFGIKAQGQIETQRKIIFFASFLFRDKRKACPAGGL